MKGTRLSFEPVIFTLLDGNMRMPPTATRGESWIRDTSTQRAYVGTLVTAARNANNCRIESINPFGEAAVDYVGLSSYVSRRLPIGQFRADLKSFNSDKIPQHLRNWYP